MWNTWNIHRLMNPLKIFQAPVNKDFPNATEFARGEMSHDTDTLCKTVQKAVAYYTGEGRAMEDFFLIDIKATDSSGYFTTGQSKDTDGQHKTRYTFYHKNTETGEWDTGHQGEIMGGMDAGWTSSPLHLITKSGSWKVVIDPVQSGTCALPHGTKNIGEMTAKEADKDCEGQNRTPNSDDTCGDCIEGYVQNEHGLCSLPQGQDATIPTDYQNLMVLGVGLVGLALVLSKKRKKKAKAE